MSGKRILSMVLALILCMALSGCGGGSSTTKAPTQKWSNDWDDPSKPASRPPETDYWVDPSKPTETRAMNETEAAVTEPAYHIESLPIRVFETAFSEGRAWVGAWRESQNGKGKMVYCLIDETGKAYLTADKAGTPVTGGYTIIERDDGVDIYDANGVQTFSQTNTKEYSMKIGCSGDGLFTVHEHKSDFSEDASYFYVMDAYGNPVMNKYKGDYSYGYNEYKEYYVGNGIFVLDEIGGNDSIKRESLICNTNAERPCWYLSWKETENNVGWDHIFPFENGTACVTLFQVSYGSSGVTTAYYFEATITAEEMQSFDKMLEWINHFIHGEDYKSLREGGKLTGTERAYYNLHERTDYSAPYEGVFTHKEWYDYSKRYYKMFHVTDSNSNYIANFDYYPNKDKMIQVGNFYGDYLPIMLAGADSYFYATVTYRDGADMKELYAPVCLGKGREYEPSWDNYSLNPMVKDFAFNRKGYLCYDSFRFDPKTSGYILIEPNGNMVALNDYRPTYGSFIRMDDNYIYFDNCLTDLKLNVVLSQVSCKVYDENVPTQPSVDTAKKYIDPASFSIEGKWKSVGGYGFGQAQPGAIVTFDGVHCNLYSPADTYAFYKSGGRFVLDCTSVLSGTASFTVKIIDENNIDLYSGGYVTELKKVN